MLGLRAQLIAVDARHDHVAHQDVEGARVQVLQRFFPRRCQRHLETGILQVRSQLRALGGTAVDREYRSAADHAPLVGMVKGGLKQR